MLDFACELDNVVNAWPGDQPLSVVQLADLTHTTVPKTVDILSDVLNREVEVHESLTHVEVSQALNILKDKLQVQLAARQRRLAARREKAINAYDVTMEKVRVLQQAGDLRAAYKTMSYYVGRYEKDVPIDLLMTMVSDCLRLGIKSNANLQELSMWLRKGVRACTHVANADAIADALDFIDAYSGYFKTDGAEKGQRLLANIMDSLREPVATYNLIDEYDSLLKELKVG